MLTSISGRTPKEFGNSANALADTASLFSGVFSISGDNLNFLISEVSLIQTYWQANAQKTGNANAIETAIAWSNILYSLLNYQETTMGIDKIETSVTASGDTSFHLTPSIAPDDNNGVLLTLAVPPQVSGQTGGNTATGGDTKWQSGGATYSDAGITVCLPLEPEIYRKESDLPLSFPKNLSENQLDLQPAITAAIKKVFANYDATQLVNLKLGCQAQCWSDVQIRGISVTNSALTDILIQVGNQEYPINHTIGVGFEGGTSQFGSYIWAGWSDYYVGSPTNPIGSQPVLLTYDFELGSGLILYIKCLTFHGAASWTFNYTNVDGITFPTSTIPNAEQDAITQIFNTGTQIGHGSNQNGGFIYPMSFPNSYEFLGNAPVDISNIKVDYFIDSSDSGTTAFYLFANPDGTNRLAPGVDVPIQVGAQRGTINIVPTNKITTGTPIYINWSPSQKANNWPIYTISFTFS